MVNRRQFLGVSGALLVSTTGIAALAGCSQGKSSGERVLVIGAGIAGLGAARQLVAAGHEVVVLEGRDRIGGRIWTSERWVGAPMDLGASWIHGIEDNPITALADQFGVKRAITRYDNAILYDTSGAVASPEREAAIEEQEEILDTALTKARRRGRDTSIQAAIEESLDWDALSETERIDLEFYLNSTLEQEYAGDTASLSAKFYDDGEEFDGDDVLFPQGYKAIVDGLAQGVDIRLSQRVEAIAYDQNGVTVTTNQGDFSAQRVIVTLPLGVLKKGDVQFTPALPPEKVAAIASLGMGVLNKCFLTFPTAFWPAEYDWLEYLSARKGWWTEWVSLDRLFKRPILLGFNAATVGREIEAYSDEQIVDSAMATLRTIFGRSIPDPIDYQLTRWASDPFAYGSYSYNAVGSNRDTRLELAKPIAGRVFFAGEATSADYAATVHGAYLSGVQAAKMLDE